MLIEQTTKTSFTDDIIQIECFCYKIVIYWYKIYHSYEKLFGYHFWNIVTYIYVLFFYFIMLMNNISNLF